MNLKPMFEEAKSTHGVKGVITIAKDANDREGWIGFYKKLMKSIKGGGKNEQPEKTGATPTLTEMAAPNRERQVKKLKKKLPKTYKDKKTGKRKKSNAFAVSWASFNKGKKKSVKEQDKKKNDDEETPEDDDSSNFSTLGQDVPNKGVKGSPEKGDIEQPYIEKGGEGAEFKSGVVPKQPTTEPQLFGPDVDIFKTPYSNIKGSEYTYEFRTKKTADGKFMCEMIVWDSPGGTVKGGKGENLKFNNSFLMTFADKDTFNETLRHLRWQISKKVEELESHG